MNRPAIFVSRVFYALLILSYLLPPCAVAQNAQKAVIMAWDGTVSLFAQQLLRAGRLPNLAKLIEGGAFSDDVMAGFPSKTAPGFASLMTGAPPPLTGISGNRVPRAPSEQFTILDSLAGFSGAPLRAEPIWATARRGGKKIIVSHIPSFADERAESVVRFSGYNLIAGRDGIVTKRAMQSEITQPWDNPPPSDAAPIELSFKVGESHFVGMLIDDPADPQIGYDTMVIATRRNGDDVKVRLKPASPSISGALFWSAPITVTTASGQETKSYFRLFDLKPDGSDFFLYFSRPARELEIDATTEASPTVRAFIGNGASMLYQNGGFGSTIGKGGNGNAEARYLETILFAQHQLMETNRWAMEHLPWDIYLAYTPFPDEAEHAWRGWLDYTLANFRQEIADRIRPLLEQVYVSCDEHLGLLMAHRPSGALFALVSDHGMQGANKRVAINQVLQQGVLLSVDGQGRVDLSKTKVLYPAINNGYLLINSTDRKSGIVGQKDRADLVHKISELLFSIRDGERQVVKAVFDADRDGEYKGIGGEVGGHLYIELAPGYDFDPRIGPGRIISDVEPYGTHGANPEQASMRTLMVFNGPGIRAGQKLSNVRIIDFAPTLAWLLGLPQPKDATGKVLHEAFTDPAR
jgi:predicted AlkP superfamily phosphohydrolase/phosphomutase